MISGHTVTQSRSPEDFQKNLYIYRVYLGITVGAGLSRTASHALAFEVLSELSRDALLK